MLTTLSSICDRIKRKHSIARRRRERAVVAGLIAELNELEVRLENAVLSDERLIKENRAIIEIFYNNVELAKYHNRRGNTEEVQASRAEARSTVICIERNARAVRKNNSVQYTIN